MQADHHNKSLDMFNETNQNMLGKITDRRNMSKDTGSDIEDIMNVMPIDDAFKLPKQKDNYFLDSFRADQVIPVNSKSDCDSMINLGD